MKKWNAKVDFKHVDKGSIFTLKKIRKMTFRPSALATNQTTNNNQTTNQFIDQSINQSVNQCLETFYADSVLFLTLPKGEENDRFDCEKLKHWIIRAEHISRSLIKQEECIQSQRNCYVVHYCDVKITTVRSEMGSKNKKRQSDKNQEN